MDAPEHIHVKRLGVVVPLTAEQLLDAGLPLPEGMEPPPEPKPLPWRLRWRIARAEFLWSARRRVGFWIAGHEPDDEDW